jgi:Flp pilus assembly protein TadG
MAPWWKARWLAARPSRRLRGDRGSMALELSIITPAIIALLWMMISAGRIVDAASKVEGAARDGARAASINHAGQPLFFANVAVRNSLQANGITCVNAPTVELTSTSPTGENHGDQPQPGDKAAVTVSCKVALLLGGVDATVTRTGVSVLDTFRGTT